MVLNNNPNNPENYREQDNYLKLILKVLQVVEPHEDVQHQHTHVAF